MFKWYAASTVCYVYMSDVLARGPRDVGTNVNLAKSRWFSRGWTLQELLAPNCIRFYDRNWQYIGNKKDMCHQLSEITRIERQYLLDASRICNASVAARMSWASDRSTTRLEDEAYCLLGLFNVNMPLLYGEGAKAFLRLQQEITKDSDDESLFAWHAHGSSSGPFAPCASAFKNSGDIYPLTRTPIERPPYSITNRGLCIDIICKRISLDALEGRTITIEQEARWYEHLIFPLNCAPRGQENQPIWIIVKSQSPVTSGKALPIFNRVFLNKVCVPERYFESSTGVHERKIYIQNPSDKPACINDRRRSPARGPFKPLPKGRQPSKSESAPPVQRTQRRGRYLGFRDQREESAPLDKWSTVSTQRATLGLRSR
ncbi:MAG: hypothetical protein Q9219_007383 [cf. Caloplaca sp. 3 TL-2023]